MWTTKSLAVTSILHGCLYHLSNISRAYHRNSKSAVIIAATVLGAPSTIELHVLLLLWDRVWRVTWVCFYYNQMSALPLDHSHRPSNPANHKIEQLTNWFVLCILPGYSHYSACTQITTCIHKNDRTLTSLQNIYNTYKWKSN